jgi:AmiR/NasT family two-component response regulator
VIQAGQELTAQLQTALNSRVAIEQAKGLIAAHAGVDMNRAFEMLRTYARRSHARLSVLAAEVAAGRFPVAQVIAAADPR